MEIKTNINKLDLIKLNLQLNRFILKNNKLKSFFAQQRKLKKEDIKTILKMEETNYK